jgi:hypothetical protein
LPRPIIIPDVLTLETLADVRTLVEKHLPAEYRSKFTWRQLAGLLKRAAEGQQDVAEVSTALTDRAAISTVVEAFGRVRTRRAGLRSCDGAKVKEAA